MNLVKIHIYGKARLDISPTTQYNLYSIYVMTCVDNNYY